MSTLLVDIGNTRAKWAVLRGRAPGRMQALAHDGRASALRSLVRAAPAGVTRILAVSVAGPRLDRALSAAARARFGVTPEFLRPARNAGGVRNGYREVWRLGLDRWAGSIGAHALVPSRPVVIANIGTALTIDAVSADGRHLGGAIAAGPDTMIASLLAGTHGIRRRARGSRRGGSVAATKLFAADTASALESGALFAAAGLIDRAVSEAAAAMGAQPVLLLTGGAAGTLRRHVKSSARIVPDLVLRGLAALA
jgi:type III pantothenate kinase